MMINIKKGQIFSVLFTDRKEIPYESTEEYLYLSSFPTLEKRDIQNLELSSPDIKKFTEEMRKHWANITFGATQFQKIFVCVKNNQKLSKVQTLLVYYLCLSYIIQDDTRFEANEISYLLNTFLYLNIQTELKNEVDRYIDTEILLVRLLIGRAFSIQSFQLTEEFCSQVLEYVFRTEPTNNVIRILSKLITVTTEENKRFLPDEKMKDILIFFQNNADKIDTREREIFAESVHLHTFSLEPNTISLYIAACPKSHILGVTQLASIFIQKYQSKQSFYSIPDFKIINNHSSERLTPSAEINTNKPFQLQNIPEIFLESDAGKDILGEDELSILTIAKNIATLDPFNRSEFIKQIIRDISSNPENRLEAITVLIILKRFIRVNYISLVECLSSIIESPISEPNQTVFGPAELPLPLSKLRADILNISIKTGDNVFLKNLFETMSNNTLLIAELCGRLYAQNYCVDLGEFISTIVTHAIDNCIRTQNDNYIDSAINSLLCYSILMLEKWFKYPQFCDAFFELLRFNRFTKTISAAFSNILTADSAKNGISPLIENIEECLSNNIDIIHVLRNICSKTITDNSIMEKVFPLLPSFIKIIEKKPSLEDITLLMKFMNIKAMGDENFKLFPSQGLAISQSFQKVSKDEINQKIFKQAVLLMSGGGSLPPAVINTVIIKRPIFASFMFRLFGFHSQFYKIIDLFLDTTKESTWNRQSLLASKIAEPLFTYLIQDGNGPFTLWGQHVDVNLPASYRHKVIDLIMRLISTDITNPLVDHLLHFAINDDSDKGRLLLNSLLHRISEERSLPPNRFSITTEPGLKISGNFNFCQEFTFGIWLKTNPTLIKRDSEPIILFKAIQNKKEFSIYIDTDNKIKAMLFSKDSRTRVHLIDRPFLDKWSLYVFSLAVTSKADKKQFKFTNYRMFQGAESLEYKSSEFINTGMTDVKEAMIGIGPHLEFEYATAGTVYFWNRSVTPEEVLDVFNEPWNIPKDSVFTTTAPIITTMMKSSNFTITANEKRFLCNCLSSAASYRLNYEDIVVAASRANDSERATKILSLLEAAPIITQFKNESEKPKKPDIELAALLSRMHVKSIAVFRVLVRAMVKRMFVADAVFDISSFYGLPCFPEVVGALSTLIVEWAPKFNMFQIPNADQNQLHISTMLELIHAYWVTYESLDPHTRELFEVAISRGMQVTRGFVESRTILEMAIAAPSDSQRAVFLRMIPESAEGAGGLQTLFGAIMRSPSPKVVSEALLAMKRCYSFVFYTYSAALIARLPQFSTKNIGFDACASVFSSGNTVWSIVDELSASMRTDPSLFPVVCLIACSRNIAIKEVPEAASAVSGALWYFFPVLYAVRNECAEVARWIGRTIAFNDRASDILVFALMRSSPSSKFDVLFEICEAALAVEDCRCVDDIIVMLTMSLFFRLSQSFVVPPAIEKALGMRPGGPNYSPIPINSASDFLNLIDMKVGSLSFYFAPDLNEQVRLSSPRADLARRATAASPSKTDLAEVIAAAEEGFRCESKADFDRRERILANMQKYAQDNLKYVIEQIQAQAAVARSFAFADYSPIAIANEVENYTQPMRRKLSRSSDV